MKVKGKFIQTTDLRAFNLLNRYYELHVADSPLKTFKKTRHMSLRVPSSAICPHLPSNRVSPITYNNINCSSTSLETISINYRLDWPIAFSYDIPIHELMFVSHLWRHARVDKMVCDTSSLPPVNDDAKYWLRVRL